MTSTFQNPADKTGLGRLLTERMSRVLEEPTGPPPDYTLDYGYEGGVSEGEEELNEEEEGAPSDLASLASDSRESVSEGSRQRDPREDGTLGRAFDDLDRLPDPESIPRLPTPPSLPPPPPHPQNTSF
ncbi:unnamed protein product [Schistocephalus solidus]|uniref:Bravo_FIGEY domain-containing protein n=1 Tax=Schistocephalus solidus TaxID=70667 RepID=A0A183SYB8_SCHSO|nr:unnamed protein product [Schistocephalus solidus]